MTLVQAAANVISKCESSDMDDIDFGRGSIREDIANLKTALDLECNRTDTIRNNLRAQIASSALQGILANQAWNGFSMQAYCIKETEAFRIASQMAILYADTLLNLLEKP